MTRVTVIDPDEEVLDLYRDVLAELGYEVATLRDALPGIEALVGTRPDLVIIDVELDAHREQLTGLQVVHSARSGTLLKDIPFIVCTTATERIAAALPDVMERGDVHRLEKPFDLATLERTVQAALGLNHGQADAPGSGTILAGTRRDAR